MNIHQKGSAKVVILLIVLLAIAIGYYVYTDREAPTVENTVTVTEPLLTIQTEGGFCMYGMCNAKLTIADSGTYHYENGQNDVKDGTLAAEDVANLKQLIGSANYAQIKSVPFTDTCPIAYDGQKYIYTFKTAAGNIKVDTCETKVDPTNPLFIQIEKIQTAITTTE